MKMSKTKTTVNAHVINLSSYEIPEAKEVAGKEFVEYGVDNDYYSFLIKTYIESPTSFAIINGIVNLIYGKGLDASDSNRKPDEYAQMKSLFKNEEVRRVIQDLKLLGEGAFQVIYKGSKVSKVLHFPRQTLRPEKANDKGEIEAYLYHPDWAKYKKTDELVRIPVFNSEAKKKKQQVLVVRKYVTGFHYVSPPDYIGGIEYAVMEKDISDYLINDVQNGFSGTKIVNFNNGVPSREEQLQVKGDVMDKLSGSNGEKIVIAFNNNQESRTTIDDIPLNNAPEHYAYLSDECSKKLMISNRVTSPLLLGIRDGNSSLGSNADELKNSFQLFDNIVIKPYQLLMLEAIDSILAVNGIALNTYFKTLEPIEFSEIDPLLTDEEEEQEIGVKMSLNLSESEQLDIADKLIALGENEDDLLADYNLEHEAEVDYELEDQLDEIITDLNTEDDSTLLAKIWDFVSTGKARPYRKSEQDGTSKKEGQEGVEFLVRYKYTQAPGKLKTNESRTFCDKMMKAQKIYRKEDILEMGTQQVNPGFQKGGKTNPDGTYSIWLNKETDCVNKKIELYKGGPRCFHRWTRRTFARKGGRSLGEAISTTQSIKRGFRPESNNNKVSIAPKNMQYAGYTKAYWDKMGFEN